MPNLGDDPFPTRYRRSLGIGGWIGGVLLTIVFYNVTTPKIVRSSSEGGRDLSNVPTIQVGALPVT